MRSTIWKKKETAEIKTLAWSRRIERSYENQIYQDMLNTLGEECPSDVTLKTELQASKEVNFRER